MNVGTAKRRERDRVRSVGWKDVENGREGEVVARPPRRRVSSSEGVRESVEGRWEVARRV
jgi:hypothetical protein